MTALLVWYLAVGVAIGLAALVWFVAQMPGKPDFIDGTFAALIGLVVIGVWPIVVLGVALTYLMRKLHGAAAAVELVD